MAQAGGIDRPGRRTLARPDVEPQVVVVAAGGDECRPPPLRHPHHVKADDAMVEGHCLLDIPDVEVDVAHPRLGRQRGIEAVTRGEVREHLVQVHRIPARPQVACRVAGEEDAVLHAEESVLGALDVDLDPVAVRIREIVRLGHRVVGGCLRVADRGEAPDHSGELPAVGQQQGEVVEARGALDDGAVRPRHEDDEVTAAGRAEPKLLRSFREQAQADDVPVERLRGLPIGDPEVDGADAGGGGDGKGGGWCGGRLEHGRCLHERCNRAGQPQIPARFPWAPTTR